MAIKFTQIVGYPNVTRLDSSRTTRQLLLQRLAAIEQGLLDIPGVRFAHGPLRELLGDTPAEHQWRADCFVVKPLKVQWDRVYEIINMVEAAPYDKIPDAHGNFMIDCYLRPQVEYTGGEAVVTYRDGKIERYDTLAVADAVADAYLADLKRAEERAFHGETEIPGMAP